MGVHDRDYMKAGGAGATLWAAPRLTYALIAVNGVLWFLFSSAVRSATLDATGHIADDGLFGFVYHHLMLWPEHVFGRGEVWQLFTTFWLHDWGGASHVVFNMLALFFFGRAVETWLGPRRYLVLYLGAGLFASLIYTGWSAVAGNVIPALGASGAVYAVLAWMACQQPRATVYMMMIIPMPMWLAVGVFMIGMEVLAVAGAATTAGSAVAHLSGAAFGAGYWLWLRRRHATRGPGGWLVRQRRQGGGDPAEREALIRLRVEQLLDKISQEGIGVLSPEEKAFLEAAARRFQGP